MVRNKSSMADLNDNQNSSTDQENVLVLNKVVIDGFLGYEKEIEITTDNGNAFLLGPGAAGKSIMLNLIQACLYNCLFIRKYSGLNSGLNPGLNPFIRLSVGNPSKVSVLFKISGILKFNLEKINNIIYDFILSESESESESESLELKKNLKFKFLEFVIDDFKMKNEKIVSFSSKIYAKGDEKSEFKEPLVTSLNNNLLEIISWKRKIVLLKSRPSYESYLTNIRELIPELKDDNSSLLLDPFCVYLKFNFNNYFSYVDQDRGASWVVKPYGREEKHKIDNYVGSQKFGVSSGSDCLSLLQKWYHDPSMKNQFNWVNDNLKKLTNYTLQPQDDLDILIRNVLMGRNELKRNDWIDKLVKISKESNGYVGKCIDALRKEFVPCIEDFGKYDNNNGRVVTIYETVTFFHLEDSKHNEFLIKNGNDIEMFPRFIPGTVKSLILTLTCLARGGFVMLDEPEMHLHPPMIRRLSQLIKSSLVVTHSAEILPPNLNCCYHIGSKQKNSTSRFVPLSDIFSTKKEEKVPGDITSGKRRELLFSSRLLIVEGKNDVKFLRGLRRAMQSNPITSESSLYLSEWSIEEINGKHNTFLIKLIDKIGIDWLFLRDLDSKDGSCSDNSNFSETIKVTKDLCKSFNQISPKLAADLTKKESISLNELYYKFNTFVWKDCLESMLVCFKNAIEYLWESLTNRQKIYTGCNNAEEWVKTIKNKKKNGLHEMWNQIDDDAIKEMCNIILSDEKFPKSELGLFCSLFKGEEI